MLRHKFQNIRINFRAAMIGQKNRSRLGFCTQDMTHPIFFLIGSGQFVAFYHAFPIIFHRHGRYHANLNMALPPLAINIETRRRILLHFPFFCIAFQIFPCPGIYLRIIRFRSLRQNSFRLSHCQKTVGMCFYLRSGFFRIHHIVRKRSNF